MTHSPIEALMLGALLGRATRHQSDFDRHLLHCNDGRTVAMFLNHPVLTYRVDILLLPLRPATRMFGLAIECDGHDFHDRTKQQAAYDRSRDRELLLHHVPITTIRFTGSEIFHSKERCAGQAMQVFWSLAAAASWCG